MKLNISAINDTKPLLILYSSGLGGEFITKTISNLCKDFNDITFKETNSTNQTHSRCAIKYGVLWTDPHDTKTWIDQDAPLQDLSKRVIIKDHPSVYIAKHYWKQLSNLQVIHLVVDKEIEYFARLTVKKLAKPIDVKHINRKWIDEEIDGKVTKKIADGIIEWAQPYPWVWQNELRTVHTFLSEGRSTDTYKHEQHPERQVAMQSDALAYQCNEMSDVLKEIYTDYNTVCVDQLTTSSKEFWKDIKKLVPTLPVAKAAKLTQVWIDKNNEL